MIIFNINMIFKIMTILMIKVRGETPLTNHEHRHSGLGLVASKLAQVTKKKQKTKKTNKQFKQTNKPTMSTDTLVLGYVLRNWHR